MGAEVSGKSALVVHNVKNFHVTHSELIRSLRRRFASVVVKDSRTIGSFTSRKDKKFVFDMAVVALAKSADMFTIVERLELFDFYDQGGRVLILGDNFISQPYRITLSLFGFDALTVPSAEPALNVQRDLHSRLLFVDKAELPFVPLLRGVQKGFFYEGNGVTITPYETDRVSIFLPLPAHSMVVSSKNETFQVLDPNSGLIAFAQGKHVPARTVVTGSFRLFSNELLNRSGGDNFHLMENLLDWLDFKLMVVTVRNFAFCKTLSADCEPTSVFRPRDRVHVKFQAFDESGAQLQDPKNFFLRLKMYEVFLLQGFSAVTLDGQLFFTYSFDAFDHIGIYKSTLLFNRPAHQLIAPGTEQEIIFRIFREDENEIFKLQALPFLAAILLVFTSAFLVGWFTLRTPKLAPK